MAFLRACLNEVRERSAERDGVCLTLPVPAGCALQARSLRPVPAHAPDLPALSIALPSDVSPRLRHPACDTYLPRRYLQPMIESGMLMVVKVTPSLPDALYVALYRTDQHSSLIKSIAMLAQESCDFSRVFRTEEATGDAP